MSTGITKGLTSLLGIETDAGTKEMQQAIAALQAVGVPTAEQLNLPELQKYVSAGVLSPEQYQAILADPEIYSQTIQQNSDNTGSDAQKAALQQLGGIVQSGGSTPIMQAQLRNNLDSVNQQMQGSRGAIEQNAQERGVAGGGLEFLSKLMNEQSGAQNANLAGVNAASDNAKLALSALSQQGQLGGQLQGQQNQMAQSQAQAAQQIAEYNSQLRSQANQYNTEQANNAQIANLANAQDISNSNTGLSNYRTQYNAQVPQQVFNNEMQKAGGMADAYGNAGQLKQQQSAQDAALTGGLIGAGGSVYGDYLKGKKQGYAEGGQVMRYQPKQQAAPSHHSNGVPKEALMALAGVMAAYPILKHAFGNSGSQETSLRQDMGSQMSNPEDPMQMAHGGQAGCYAQGGEVHDHDLCMKAGGPVPGDESGMPPMMDDESQDTVPANLSPGEIVLPRSVSQAPDAPQKAQQFVSQINGQSQPGSFSEILAKLEENGLELRLASK